MYSTPPREMNLALRLNFQSRCSNFHPTLFPNIPILRSFLFSITFARHIRPRESLREKIRISRKNINLLHSLEISNGFKNRSPFFPSRIKKGEREKEKALVSQRGYAVRLNSVIELSGGDPC